MRLREARELKQHSEETDEKEELHREAGMLLRVPEVLRVLCRGAGQCPDERPTRVENDGNDGIGPHWDELCRQDAEAVNFERRR